MTKVSPSLEVSPPIVLGIKMITFDKALKIVLDNAKPLESEEVNLKDAFNKVLARDVYASVHIPPFDNSAMDGFAVQAEDTKNASNSKPVVLKIIEDIPAGYVPKKTVKKGQAARIMTGAMMPEAADSVVKQEDVEEKNGFIKIFQPVPSSDNLRQTGEDIKKGNLVFKKGSLIKSAHLGVLASLGFKKVKAIKSPKVSFLVTGNELVDLRNKILPRGKIRSSNSFTLWGQLQNSAAAANDLGIARDNLSDLKLKIKRGLQADILLICGGVSVGKYDFVKQALQESGVKILFWKVKIRPGKPVLFGRKGSTIIFGIPGNPASSYIIFEQFIRPAILKIKGIKGDVRHIISAQITEEIKKPKGVRYFVRAFTFSKNNRFVTQPIAPHGSGILSSLAMANSLLILPEKLSRIKKNQLVKIQFINF